MPGVWCQAQALWHRQCGSAQALAALESSADEDHSRTRHHSFFSSELGGIVTDPALMVVPIDDHLVHRGHGVFDTASLVDGYLYELDEHLERFQRSMRLAMLEPLYTMAQMRRIILDTAAASCKLNGEWLVDLFVI